MLIDKGANINVTDKNGNSALILAATHGNTYQMKTAIQKTNVTFLSLHYRTRKFDKTDN